MQAQKQARVDTSPQQKQYYARHLLMMEKPVPDQEGNEKTTPEKRVKKSHTDIVLFVYKYSKQQQRSVIIILTIY